MASAAMETEERTTGGASRPAGDAGGASRPAGMGPRSFATPRCKESAHQIEWIDHELGETNKHVAAVLGFPPGSAMPGDSAMPAPPLDGVIDGAMRDSASPLRAKTRLPLAISEEREPHAWVILVLAIWLPIVDNPPALVRIHPGPRHVDAAELRRQAGNGFAVISALTSGSAIPPAVGSGITAEETRSR